MRLQEVFHLTGLGRKYCSNRCRDLNKYYGVSAIPENVGRQVTYRLISPNHITNVRGIGCRCMGLLLFLLMVVLFQGTLVQNLQNLQEESTVNGEEEKSVDITSIANKRKSTSTPSKSKKNNEQGPKAKRQKIENSSLSERSLQPDVSSEKAVHVGQTDQIEEDEQPAVSALPTATEQPKLPTWVPFSLTHFHSCSRGGEPTYFTTFRLRTKNVGH